MIAYTEDELLLIITTTNEKKGLKIVSDYITEYKILYENIFKKNI